MHVLLFPEDIDGRAPSDSPVYATVVGSGTTVSTVSLLSDPPGRRVRVQNALLDVRRVDDDEFEAGAPGEWMRKGVVGLSEGAYRYGQVTSYTQDTLTIRGRLTEHTCPTTTVVEVAPVICMLMNRSAISSGDVDGDELAAQHNLILDRVLGENSQSATKSVAKLLQGIVPQRFHPAGTDSFTWTNATLGTESTVTLRHAIDYAYYVDGGRRIPTSLAAKIGSRFDDDPTTNGGGVTAAAHAVTNANGAGGRSRVVAAGQAATNDNGGASRSRAADDDDDEEALMALLAAVDPPPPIAAAPASPRPQPPRQSSGAMSTAIQSRVLDAISDDPALVRFYLCQCKSLDQLKRRAPEHTEPPSQRRRTDAPSDLIDLYEAGDRSRSKHIFRPTRPQQAIQALLSAREHTGKTPAELMDTMVSSRATKFKPHPAILSRLYDFQFGLRGLTIMHFERFDLTARRRWYAEGTVNMNNFSVVVELPRARKPRSLTDLSDAMAVLLVFVDEFMDDHARRLLSSAKEFVEDLREYGLWSDKDVESIAYWFDNVFEDFRRAVEHDIAQGTSSRGDIKNKFSMQDPSLQIMLYIIQSERVASMNTVPSLPRQPPPETVPRPDNGRRVDGRPNRATPRDVLEALPRQGRSSMCLKHLSAQGCPSKSPDRCAFPNRAHFVPASLPLVVRRHIVDSLGGLRAGLNL